jgi:hypothetical protein
MGTGRPPSGPCSIQWRGDLGGLRIPPGDGEIVLLMATQDGNLAMLPLRPRQIEEVVVVGHPSRMESGRSPPPLNSVAMVAPPPWVAPWWLSRTSAAPVPDPVPRP